MIDTKKLLFFDIETHRVKELKELSPAMALAFEEHVYNKSEGDFGGTLTDCYKYKSALIPEFSHVICISMGYELEDGTLKLASISGVDEVKLLTDFSKVTEYFYSNGYHLAGHNINGFDKPYLIKRYIINQIKVPSILKTFDKKPWEQEDIDTLQFYKFGGYTSASLQVISAALDIACKTTEVRGDNLFELDIDKVDFNELVKYCEEDVQSNHDGFVKMLNVLQ